MPRRGTALIALGIVLALVAALLPGTDLQALALPLFSFVIVTFAWSVAAPADQPLPTAADAPAPLDTRGPPRVSLA